MNATAPTTQASAATTEHDAAVASSCPLAYRYGAAALRSVEPDHAHTVYVVGGLYGNPEALDTIEALQAREQAAGVPVQLVFNGDYNWFNTDAATFVRVNETALRSLSIRGNVEAELAADDDAGCGCDYPAYFNDAYVQRSNAIMAQLRQRARQHPALTQALQQLPFYRVVQIGRMRIGVVHGDANSLAGWDFAAERLSPIGKCCSGDSATAELTPLSRIEQAFRAAHVQAFASSHTCLAHARDYAVDGRNCLIINNGAAGLPNFSGMQYGLITRISCDTRIPDNSLYGIEVDGVRFDAIPVHYNAARWEDRFIANWPAGSPAFEAYWERIRHGPDFALEHACGGRVARQ